VERKQLLLFLCASVALCAAPALLGQEQAQDQVSGRLRLRGQHTFRSSAPRIDLETIKGEMAKSATLPLWTFDVHSSRDGNSYAGAMVGRDPYNNPGSVSVVTYVIPLILETQEIGTSIDPQTGIITTKPGVTTFNPTVPDTACLSAPNNVPTALFHQSPLLNPATFDFGGTVVGTTEYSDAFQRSNFWKVLGSHVDEYHVLLNPKFLDPIVIEVPKVYGLALATTALGPPPFCAPVGIVDINWFDAYLTGTVIPALAARGVNPTNFPIFFVHNLAWDSPVTNINDCCILGYHGATGFPIPTQTYSPADFDSTGIFGPAVINVATEDTDNLSHEVAEWMDDPFGINPTPPWGHVGEQSACQNNLEVADPLSETEAPPIVMSNGFTYHLQELAFFSWFFGEPSVGVSGWFSNNGTFLTDAGPPCQP
jgi:hypothetical protein